MPTIIRHTRLSQHDTRMYTKEIIVSICFPFSHALLASVPICSILFSPSDLVSSRRVGRLCALELAEGGGALVFELGVEQIAAADGGDVEAFWKVKSVLCFFLLFSLR